MKAPGASTNTSDPKVSGYIVKSKILPVPKNSLTAPSIVRAIVNPIPVPSPSSIESKTLFFEAKASALPSSTQFI